MTTRIFFNNQTAATFRLTDVDNNRFPLISGGNTYSLQLHYSDSWETQYSLILTTTGQTVYFWLTQDGTVGRVQSGIALLQPGNVGDKRGSPTNEIFIYPNNGSLPFTPPKLFPPTPLPILFYNDY